MLRRHLIVGIPGLVLIFCGLVATYYFAAGLYRPGSISDSQSVLMTFGSGLAFVVGYALIGYVGIDRTRQRRVFITNLEMGLAGVLQERERSIAESGEPLSLPVLWSVTQERIDYYHRIATNQAEVSFRNGAITSYIGFSLLIGFAVLGALTASNLYTSITLGVLGAAGAALTGYLGATFIKLQSEASSQLRQFFSQPVDFLRLLGAERLIATLPESERAASVRVVITSVMNNAQRGTSEE
jgi:hypothetical protein